MLDRYRIWKSNLIHTLLTYVPKRVLYYMVIRAYALTSFHFPQKEMDNIRPRDVLEALK